MMSKIRRIILPMLAVFMALMTSCASTKLPEGFSEEEVNAAADKVVTLISDKDFDKAVELFSAEMASKLDAAALESAIGSTIDKLGAFEKVTSRAVSGQSSDDGKKYAVAVLVCKYENGTAAYTVSIDEDGRVAGLYMK